jgi:hypothetical protein
MVLWLPALACLLLPPPGDPLSAIVEATLQAEDTSAEAFGSAVAVANDTAIVGCRKDGEAAPEAGAAYVFVREGTRWVQQAKLIASDAAEDDHFGALVAISEDTAVVSAPGDDGVFGGDVGSVYVFVRDGETWSQQDKFWMLSSVSLAISGDTLVVGENISYAKGHAVVLVRSGGAWSSQANLHPAGLSTNAHFGDAVALQGDTLLVGAPLDNSHGRAYVFVRSGDVWSQQAMLGSGGTGDGFGSSVALSGETALIGRPGDNFATWTDAGSASVYVRNGTSWSHQATLQASDAQDGDRAGQAVALRGGLAVVGAYAADTGALNSGAAYVWVRNGTSWTGHVKLSPEVPAPFGNLSSDLALVGNTLLATEFNAPEGLVRVYRLQTSWTDLGAGLAGAFGVPSLAGSGPLVEGLPEQLVLQDAAPLAPCLLFVSLASVPAPFKGGTLTAFPALVSLPLLTTAGGSIELGFTWPAGLPASTTLWFQYAIADAAAIQGVALSNALSATTP